MPPGTGFVATHSGRAGVVRDLLGAGGQGAVYAVECEGARLALKWYHPHVVQADTGLRERLTRAVLRGPPDNSFLWPIDLVEIRGRPSFGYLMPLREGHLRCMRDLIARPPQRLELDLRTRLLVCLRIAESMLALHANGFCYQDINFGNFFLDPASGGVCIVDNDNVDVDGIPGGVYGTRKFMAPEVVRHEALPSSRTDLFSMAVLFFYILAGWHPLEGRQEAEVKMMDAASELRLFGTAPRFIFDPDDASNGPIPGYHDGVVARWNTLDSTLQALFVRSFGPGLMKREARVLESEWTTALAQAMGAIQRCPGCGAEHVFDPQAPARACVVCRQPLPQPPHLLIGRQAIVLDGAARVPLYAIAGGRPDLAREAASLEHHPTDPAIVGLCNRTARVWRLRLPDGRRAEVPPGKTFRLIDGAEIDFGGRRGVVRWPAAAEALPG